MNPIDLLFRLRSLNIRLWAEDDQLRVSAPKGGITDDLLAEIKRNKEELLTRIQGSTRFSRAVSLSPIERSDSLQLSFAQQRLWFLYHLFPEIPVYNVRLLLRLAGTMDVSALQKSLQALVDRHESLRTCFPTVDDEPVQVIRDGCPAPLLEHNLKDLPEAERATAADKLIEEEILRPFDLTHGPVIRAALLRIADQDHILLITVHHIVTDGWSLGVIQRDLAALYNAQVLRQTPTLPALPIQYVDFAHWQRQWLTGEVLADQLRYWRTHLADLSTLALPTDRPRPPVQTHSGASHTFQLSQSLTQDLHALSRQAEVTVATTLLAAFQVLLGRYSGQTDIAVGSPIANRTRLELENLVGFFVNTLVMRTDLSGDPTFREVLARVNEVALGAYDHQDLPFEQLVGELEPERDFSRNPLFQIVFAFQNIPRETAAFQGLSIRPMGRESTTTRMDLECFVWEGKEELHVTLVFNTDLFRREPIERFGTHFQKILTEVVSDPVRRLSQISLLDEAERQRLLVDWNATATAYPRDATLAERFAEQAAATPDAVALVFAEQRLTYRELDTRTGQLAGYLHQRYGVGPEVRVGLCMERSVEMVVGLLGIIKAGGAYVPLDPNAPPGRLAFILDDADIALVLTQAAAREDLPAEWSGPVIALDSAWPTIAQTPATPLTSGANAESLAYIMYTSGSTGLPKGTSICQRSVMRLVINTNYLDLGPAETFLQFAPLAFDASTLEIWGSLLHGSKLVVFPPHQASLEELGRCLQEHEISTLWLTAAIFHQMVDSQPEALRGVRQLLSGGDVLSVPQVQQVLANLPEGGRLINGYGPTENTTFTCCHVMTAESQVESTVPIGRPIANTQVYVLDRAMQPVPVGVYGELYVGGDGLARDYLQRPALTAEKFVPHPFTGVPGARLYRTGDVVRYRSDGALEFQGRRDHQVKLRGYRIELGEIEAVLGQHPEVRATAALVREDEPGDKRLVGYIVPAQESVSASALRRYLQERVPDYMVPAHFVMLDALPVTPNGKVDRRALPTPDGVRPELDAAYQAPRGPVEQSLAEIWRDALGLAQVGIFDNFFDLGGHSLLAARIVSRLKTTFAVDIPLRAFFDSPTIAGVSATLTIARRGEEPTEKVGILPIVRHGTLPLSFAQERFWVLDQIHTERSVFNTPCGFRMRGPFQLEVFRQSVQALVDRHEVLRTTFPSVGGEPHQIIAANLPMEVPLQDCSGLSREEQAGMIQQAFREERRFEFDLAHGPLLRPRLLRFAENDHCLVLNLHHIIHDAWSLEVLIKDLVTAYTAGCLDHSTTLPALPIQYVDYAHWQRKLVEGPAGKEQLAYWKNQLAQLPPALPLPTDYARPAVQTFRGARENLRLPAELIAPLRAINRQEGITLFMLLLAALQFLLHRLTGTQDIVVGAPIAGREQQATHGLIGCFLNTLILRTDLSGIVTGRDLLQRVREVVLNAYENQEVPVEKLVAEVDLPRDPSRTPIFQVLLNMHSFDDQKLPLPELSVTRVRSTDIDSLFDITLYFQESSSEIQTSLVYNADLFAAQRMAEFMRQFRIVLEQIIDDPDRPLEALTLVTSSARSFLPDPSDPLAAPRQPLVPELITRWALDTPDHPAVRQGPQQWSYKDLASQAEKVGRFLAAKGMENGTVVALHGLSSFGLIVGMLGVLQRGGVLLMIAPVLPNARKSLMLEEADARILISTSEDESEVSWAQPESLFHLYLSPQTGEIESGDTSPLSLNRSEPSCTEGDPAYIFFTSGTTGRPKGIIGSHQSLSHFLIWQRDTFEITSADRAAQLTGLSFDVVLRDIFLPLISGGVLCLPEEADRLDGRRVLQWLDREHITVLHTVPAVATSWLATVPKDISLSNLRWVFFAGEPLTNRLVRAWRTAFSGSGKLVNLYGPTETTLAKCFYRVPEEPLHGVQPIGGPLPNTQALIMNRAHRLCGIGELGEIVVRTSFRTLGPLSTREPTGAFFQENPYRPGTQEDVYFTGDLGRYRPDGMVEILGRIDDQVKIRGVRIEPNEVMNALATHPSVHASFVMAREDNAGLPALVTYVVPTAETSPTASELRAYVARQLPPAMVPSSFVFMEAFPYTPNGKIDRQALPGPDAAGSQHEAEFVAPRTPVETLIATIWQEVLGHKQVGIHDNFFDLGGHSLLATQVVARVRDSLHIDLKLRHLFEVPVLKGLAGVVEMLKNSTQDFRSSSSNTGEDRSEIVL